MPTPKRQSPACMPLDLLEATASKKGISYVYLWLSVHNGEPVSCDTLGKEAGMNPKDVRSAIKWLVEAGYVVRRDEPGRASSYGLVGQPSQARQRRQQRRVLANPSPKR